MATISISIIKSPVELQAGIPSSITLETNIPATVFYTLDDTTPTTSSSVAVSAIRLPQDQTSVILKYFATDGSITSPVITTILGPKLVGARQPHDKIAYQGDNCGKATYPFGSSASQITPEIDYLNTGGTIADTGEGTRVAVGFDGTASNTPAAYLQDPVTNFDFLFSETNSIGQIGKGIGTIPATVISIEPRNNNTVQQSSSTSDRIFNPRALVIFQDTTKEQTVDYPIINRPHFDLEDTNKIRDGAMLTNVEPITTSGGYVRQVYSPQDNTLTFYYYDNRTCRWIISKQPYVPKATAVTSLAGMVFGRQDGIGFVFKWIPFKYHIHF